MDPEKHSVKNNDAYAETPLEVVEREIEYAKDAIERSPQNPSPWLYLRGVLRKQGMSVSRVKAFAEEFADLSHEDGTVRSSHALDLLADVYAEEGEKAKSARALDLLARKYDPIRKNYWNYRKSQLGLEQMGG